MSITLKRTFFYCHMVSLWYNDHSGVGEKNVYTKNFKGRFHGKENGC